ncbi:MAG: hypothetical protein M1298_02480 [Chloroflexi bacterium]|nr:hypothetical protein [Chloroflexota bacterium]
MQEQYKVELQRFKQDIDYYQQHQQELLIQYPESWIAIFNQHVVGRASELEHLIEDLRRRGIPPERALVEHVTAKEEVFILAGQL